MKQIIKNSIFVIVLIIIDQIIKWFTANKLAYKDFGIVAFHFVKNTGASFGMLQGNNLLLIFVSLIALGIIMMNIRHITKRYVIPVLLFVSGLLGNLLDRIFRGFVVDMIDFKWWPVFNMADSLIFIGVFLIIIEIIREEIINNNKTKSKTNKSIKKSKI